MVTTTIPTELYSAEQSRQIDQYIITQKGISGHTLMTRAGLNAFKLIQQLWPDKKQLTIITGSGNNGGDGYTIAYFAQLADYSVTLLWLKEPKELKNDAAIAVKQAQQSHVSMTPFTGSIPSHTEIIIDALLGTGLNTPVSGAYQQAIQVINNSGLPCLALDIPSGLSADTGQPLGTAVMAQATISFITVKPGLLTGNGPNFTGKLWYSDLAIPNHYYCDAFTPSAHHINANDIRQALPPRRPCSHKGHYGHVLVIGGDLGMAGAVAMAAEAAARTGAGLVSVATQPGHLTAILSRRPELMVHGITKPEHLTALISKATVIVIGPGLGQSNFGLELLQHTLQAKVPIVIDADALNLIANNKLLNDLQQTAIKPWILTPHPGEASRLLQSSTEQLQSDRLQAASSLLQKYAVAAVILKGKGSVIVCYEEKQHKTTLSLVTNGNPGMASGGMGDVLSGIIAGLIAQHVPLTTAAKIGPWIHGQAADLTAAVNGPRGLLATDLMPNIQCIMNRESFYE